MIHIEHDTGYCTKCNNYAVVYGGSAQGREATAFRLCANCGDHDVRRRTEKQDVCADELIITVRNAWGL